MDIQLGKNPDDSTDDKKAGPVEEDNHDDATHEAAERFSTAVADADPKAITRTLKLLLNLIND